MKNYYNYPELRRVLELAGITISQLGIATHHRNYTHLIIQRDEQGEIIDAWTAETTDGYYRNINPLIDSVYRTGTGSIPCNCDACINGDNPDDWAGDIEHCDGIEDEINQGIDDVRDR